jgi:pantoate--beta-alanine ligase
MRTYESAAALRAVVERWKEAGETVAFVPTMGNLHAGHLALVDLARERSDRLVVSIFVNPLQFGPEEDYAAYPRTEEEDRALLLGAGVDALFLPSVDEIYPRGEDQATFVEVPGVSDILCGAFRPGHFRGVATVVAKLFNLVDPHLAVFGAKDYQQLVVIRRMAEDLCFPLEIVACPTGREDDGLAMSSRNRYLTEAEREIAPSLHATLAQALARIDDGARDYAAICDDATERLVELGFRPDYFEVRDAVTLAPPTAETSRVVVLAAAWLGRARLIDNLRLDL